VLKITGYDQKEEHGESAMNEDILLEIIEANDNIDDELSYFMGSILLILAEVDRRQVSVK